MKSKNLSPHAVTTSAASAKGTNFFRETVNHTNPSATKSSTRRSYEATTAMIKFNETTKGVNLAPSMTPTSGKFKNSIVL